MPDRLPSLLRRPFALCAALLPLAYPAGAQDASPYCGASATYARAVNGLWLDLPNQAFELADSVSPERMQQRLAKHYRLLEITTEGAGTGKWAVVSELSLWPHLTYDTISRIGPAAQVIAYGRAVGLQKGYLHERMRNIPGGQASFFRVQYSAPSTLRLTWVPDSMSLNSEVMDGSGPILDVHEIQDGVLSGRWIDGGIAMLAYRTPVGMLAEKALGYFCAWPRK
jgi:hypothetical protein